MDLITDLANYARRQTEELLFVIKKYEDFSEEQIESLRTHLMAMFLEGADWQKEKDDMELSEKTAAAYQFGLANKEKQMMEEAVEYEVGMHGEPIKITFDKYVQRARGIFPGDKVRIIILSKED